MPFIPFMNGGGTRNFLPRFMNGADFVHRMLASHWPLGQQCFTVYGVWKQLRGAEWPSGPTHSLIHCSLAGLRCPLPTRFITAFRPLLIRAVSSYTAYRICSGGTSTVASVRAVYTGHVAISVGHTLSREAPRKRLHCLVWHTLNMVAGVASEMYIRPCSSCGRTM
jgi:hypothetical protein